MKGTRAPQASARAWVRAYLETHPGTTGPEIVAAAASMERFARSSVYKVLHDLVDAEDVHVAAGRYWKGRIEDAEIAIEAEVERTLAILRSPAIKDAAKIEAARQLSRDSSAGLPRSRAVLDLIAFGTGQPAGIRDVLLPFVQRAVRAAVRPDVERVAERRSVAERTLPPGGTAYVRQVWQAARPLLDGFLRESGERGTLAWNTVHEAIDAQGLVGDDERLELARLAVEVELRAPLPSPSPARAVLRRIVREERLASPLRSELLNRIATTKDEEERNRLSGLFREFDLAPFRTPPGDGEPA